MLKIIFLIVILLATGPAISQKDHSSQLPSTTQDYDTKEHTIYYNYSYFVFEPIHSLNIEFTVEKKQRFRTGIAYTARGVWRETESSHIGIPLGYVFLIGKKNAFLELTLGVIPLYQYKSKVVIDAIPLLELGFRLEPTDKNVLFRTHIGTSFIGLGFGGRF